MKTVVLRVCKFVQVGSKYRVNGFDILMFFETCRFIQDIPIGLCLQVESGMY